MRIIDSHTGGEPTRLIVSGGPDLGDGELSVRRKLFADEHDEFRRFAINEPRGFDAMVGALLCEPVDPTCAAGLIFFNNAGYLGMCGHGTIGAAVTLAHMGRISLGLHRFETPVGTVAVELLDPHTARIENVGSYRYRHNVALDVAGVGQVKGDVAWGGNWFFLCEDRTMPISLQHVRELTQRAEAIRKALQDAGMRGEDGGEIDHVEIFGAPMGSGNSRSFVLCPGGEYDRSPCGTGTSAKLACLAADGKWEEGVTWIQESVVGSTFEASYRRGEGRMIIPSITGTAYVVSEATLIRQLGDPFALGIGNPGRLDCATASTA